MKLLLPPTLVLVSLLSTAAAQTTEPPANQSPAKTPHVYVQLVERAKKGETVDYKQMRDAFGEWQCEKNTEVPNRQAMVEAFDKKDYAKAAELVEVVLDYEYVNRGLHLAAADAYSHLENTKKAEEHKAIAEKLLEALLTTGDGKTAKTAYRVLSIREEYFIMQQLGYKPHSQALLEDNKRMFDVLTGTDLTTKKEVSIYFDITSFFGGCSRLSRPKP